jgi:large conductance mechanosensitive channel
VIIGAACGKIVDSVINDLIMPVVGRIFGGFDFTNYFLPLKAVPEGTPATLDAVRKAGVPVFAYGSFITVAINFLVLAFIIFLMVKQFNRMKREAPPPAPPGPSEEVTLLRDIRDALRSR